MNKQVSSFIYRQTFRHSHTQTYLLRHRCQLKADVNARCCCPKNHHPQPTERLRLSVVVAVDLAAEELVDVLDWWHQWYRVVAAMEEQRDIKDDIQEREIYYLC